MVLTRLSRVVVAARSLAAMCPRPPRAPDPKAVAAAARSFADRLRERVGAVRRMNRLLRDFRLIPVVLVAIIALFVLKSSG